MQLLLDFIKDILKKHKDLISLNFFSLTLLLFSVDAIYAYAGKYVILDDLEDDPGTKYYDFLSAIPREKKVLITSKKGLTKEKSERLFHVFSEVIAVGEYFNSAEVEETVIKYSEKNEIERIISVVEYDMVRAGDLRKYLHLKGQSYESALAFRDKIAMKEKIREARLKVPPFTVTNSGLDLIRFKDKYGFPLIVKPRTYAGAVGIHLLKTSDDLESFLRTAAYNCHYISNFEVEAFVKGKVYHIDGLVHNSSIFSWPSEYINTCLETALEGKPLGAYLLSPQNPLTTKLRSYAEKVLKVLPTPQEIIFHLEVFVDENQEIVFCEIASRVGGVYIPEAWNEAFNIDLMSILYDMQAGLFDSSNFERLSLPNMVAGWLMFPGIAGKTVDNIPSTCPFSYCRKYEVSVQSGDKIQTSSGICNRLAKVLIVSESEDEFLKNTKEIISWFEKNFKYKIDK